MKFRKIAQIFMLPLITTSVAVINFSSSCSNNNTNQTIKKVDGTDWEGRLIGNFIEDDYVVDPDNKTITYISSISIHASNLVVPNYVLYKEKKYKVYIGENCFANNTGISGTVELNDFIDVIPTKCFYKCYSLKGIVFHQYPKRIEDMAFAQCMLFVKACVLLKNQTIEHNWSTKLEYVGNYSFYNCWLEGDLFLGDNLLYLGEGAFSGCSHLTRLDLRFANQIQEIPKNLCDSCSLLKKVNFPFSITSIGENAFRQCSNLETIDLPSNAMALHIGNSAFLKCFQLKEFTKFFKLLSLGSNAFAYDTNLDIQFFSNILHVDIIPFRSFASCAFSSLSFSPETADDVMSDAFAGCTNLSVLDFTGFGPDDGLPAWTGKNIFIDCNPVGTIYLSYYHEEWSPLFKRWGIKLGEGHWDIKVSSSPSPFTKVIEPEQKEYSIQLDSQRHGHVELAKFSFESVNEIQSKYLVPFLRLFSDKGIKISPTATVNNVDKTITIGIDFEVPESVQLPISDSNTISFFYYAIKIYTSQSPFKFTLTM